MRPFFLLSMFCALLLLPLWVGALAGLWAVPEVAGGALVWHAHELIFGLGTAAVAGFALTAVPEFVGMRGAGAGPLRALVLLWVLARLGFWNTGWEGALGTLALALAAIGQVGMLLYLLRLLWPALVSVEGRRHASFGVLALLLAICCAGFYADAWQGAAGLRWLYAGLGVLMLLIVVAASRISMRIVNQAIDEVAPGAAPYLARPPRRHVAALCISLYTVAEFVQPATPLVGWLGLAAAAALLNLLNDWHVGAPLWRRRFALMLYLMYWCMALGYAGLGLGALDIAPTATAGRHLLAMGGLGLGVFVVIGIAGRAHAGLSTDSGPWLGLGAVLLLTATGLRAAAAAMGGAALWWALTALLWCAAFALLMWRIGPGLWRARADGRWGC